MLDLEFIKFLEDHYYPGQSNLNAGTESFSLKTMGARPPAPGCGGPSGEARRIIPHQVDVFADYFVAHFYLTSRCDDIIEPLVFMMLSGNEKSKIVLHMCGNAVGNDVWSTIYSLMDLTKVQMEAHIATIGQVQALAVAMKCSVVETSPISMVTIPPMNFGGIGTDKLVMEDVADMRKYTDIFVQALVDSGVMTADEYARITKDSHPLVLTGEDLETRVKAHMAKASVPVQTPPEPQSTPTSDPAPTTTPEPDTLIK